MIEEVGALRAMIWDWRNSLTSSLGKESGLSVCPFCILLTVISYGRLLLLPNPLYV